MNHDDPRHKELTALHTKTCEEVPYNEGIDDDGQTEADRLTDERWAVAEAMLDHQPQTIVDLAWQTEAWLLADLEMFERSDYSPMLRKFFRHIRTLGRYLSRETLLAR